MTANCADDTLTALGRELLARFPVAEAEYPSGFRLLSEDSPCEHVYLLTSGTIKLSFVDRAGREFILGLRSAPRAVGMETALLNMPSLCSATTVTPCRARRFPAKSVRNSLKDGSEISFHMSRCLSRESIDQTRVLMELHSGNARHRLVNLLQRLNAGPGAAELSLAGTDLKRHELAKLLAVTPEHLSRLLRGLRRDGLLRSGTRRIILRNEGSAM
jgi:CRP-like cAMP-binding protein